MTVSCPAPEPETYSRDDDQGYNMDPEVSLIFKDGIFYQEDVEGAEVPLLLDRPGSLPSSSVSNLRAPCKRPTAPTAPIILTASAKGQ